MNITEPEHHTCLIRSPGESPAEVPQGDSKLQHSDAVNPGSSGQVQSPANPRESQDGWADELSPSSPFQARRRELLRVGGSPKTRALEKLRERIRQQRLDMKTVAPEGPQPTLVTHRGRVTRKIRRFTFAPSPTLRGQCEQVMSHPASIRGQESGVMGYVGLSTQPAELMAQLKQRLG
ncbi:hypothetical protein AAFF_G00010090 [Aldrovandia affinis]|uniref:Uncharacterized protein n=1 Tax=Aldrovandia affinis TaxID=143900 RepID=A0AAD7WHT7_9TELE|nr:hypothetical protein AAFF_G00010090 [Aldrovandia affinis]